MISDEYEGEEKIDLLRYLCLFYYKINSFEVAREIAEEILEILKKFEKNKLKNERKINLILALIFIGMKRPKKAIVILKKFCFNYEKPSVYYPILGDSYYLNQDFVKAFSVYDVYIDQLFSKNTEEKRFQKMISVFKKALECILKINKPKIFSKFFKKSLKVIKKTKSEEGGIKFMNTILLHLLIKLQQKKKYYFLNYSVNKIIKNQLINEDHLTY